MRIRKKITFLLTLVFILIQIAAPFSGQAALLNNPNLPVADHGCNHSCTHHHPGSLTGEPLSAEAAASLSLALESGYEPDFRTSQSIAPTATLTLNESEPNDTLETANEIQYNTKYYDQHNVYGSITAVTTDLDLFRLEVLTTGTLYLLGCWLGDYYNQGLEGKLTFGFVGDDGTVHFVSSPVMVENRLYTGYAITDIPPGTYYILACLNDQNAVQFVDENYGFSMEFVPDGCYVLTPTFYSDNAQVFLNTTTSISCRSTNCVLKEHSSMSYRFQLSDGTTTEWHYQNSRSWTWNELGTYWIKAQARCPYTNTVSQWSEPLVVEVVKPCVLTPPSLLEGPLACDLFQEYSYTCSTSTCSNGHDVSYAFLWGDNSISYTTPSTTQNKSWSPVGTYQMTIQAMCTAKYKNHSEPYPVVVSGPPVQATVFPNLPEGGTYTGDGIHQLTERFNFTAFPNDAHRFHAWVKMAEPHYGLLYRTNPHEAIISGDEFNIGLLFRKRIWPERIAGENRFQTSLLISQAGWAANSTDVVFLARSHEFADALAGVPLAYAMNAPILLTPQKTVYSSTLNEIKRVGAKRVILLGGTAAISDDVIPMLQKEGLTVERISGSNRFATAAAIADRLAVEIGPLKDAVIVTGLDFPDALSTAAYAAVHGQPILLVRQYHLPDSTKDALARLNIQNIIAVGGNSVIDYYLIERLNVPGTKIRISGNNRYDTAVAVAKHFNSTATHYYLASGTDFPDAITGAVLAARQGTGVLLVYGPGSAPMEKVQDFLVNNKTSAISLLGGPSAIGINLQNWFSN